MNHNDIDSITFLYTLKNAGLFYNPNAGFSLLGHFMGYLNIFTHVLGHF